MQSFVSDTSVAYKPIAKPITLVLAFAEQCLCREAEKACVIENENNKKVSVIYQIDRQTYLCLILPQFNTKDAGMFISEVCFNKCFNNKQYNKSLSVYMFEGYEFVFYRYQTYY